MSRERRNDAVPLSGKLKAIAADIQRAKADSEMETAPQREPVKTRKNSKKRSVEKMAKKRKSHTQAGAASAARDRMISRHDGSAEARKGGAEAARAAMLARHDGAEHESQQFVADMMRTNAGKAWEKVAQGEGPNEELVAACFRDLYDEGAMEPHQTATPSADEARARMLERMSGACPDRLPSDYSPLPGNDR